MERIQPLIPGPLMPYTIRFHPGLIYDPSQPSIRLGRATRMQRSCLATLLWLVTMPLAAAELSGRIELVSEGRVLRSEEASEVVVYFRPETAAAPVPMRAEVMSTQRKRFDPRVLAVTTGSTVSFPNRDPILHNVFSTAQGNAFDIGLIGEGEGGIARFDTPGYVRVYCNVHHAMVGHILVLDTPHFARPDASGRFRLRDLPDGPGELVIWHDRARPWRRNLDPAAGHEPVEVRLDLARRRVPPHLNKFGRPYGRDDDGNY